MHDIPSGTVPALKPSPDNRLATARLGEPLSSEAQAFLDSIPLHLFSRPKAF